MRRRVRGGTGNSRTRVPPLRLLVFPEGVHVDADAVEAVVPAPGGARLVLHGGRPTETVIRRDPEELRRLVLRRCSCECFASMGDCPHLASAAETA